MNSKDNIQPPPQGEQNRTWTDTALWYPAAYILPVFSLTFYRVAQRKTLSRAIAFFVIFATTLTALFTLKVVRTVNELDAEIEVALESGDFPTITIRDGVATVDAPQPLIVLDQGGQLFVLDTSGRYSDIDPARYREGILLTSTELIVLDSSGQRQSVQLTDLNQLFDSNPIVIDEQFVMTAWDQVSRIAVVVAALGLWLWHFFLRLIVLTVVGLLIWGSVTALRDRTDFSAVMITGLYAVVPALYFHYLLGRVGLTLPGLQTMILILTWMGISIANLDRDARPSAAFESSLLRMTPIAIPMLLVLGWDVVFTPDIDPLALWVVPTLTFISWLVMRRFQGENDQPLAGRN